MTNGGETKSDEFNVILFQTSFYLSSRAKWLSNEGKYMIEDVVKSQCSKDAGEIVRKTDQNDSSDC